MEEPAVQQHSLSSLLGSLAGSTSLRTEVLGLNASSMAWMAAGLLADNQQPLAILAADQAAAQRLCQALGFFHGNQQEVCLFPHWEVDPYTPLSPHPEIEATRMATLAALSTGRARAVVTTVPAILQRIMPRPVLADLYLHLVTGREYVRHDLLERLSELGYMRVPLVEDRGSYAVRGDLIDIYPPSFEQPVRLAFFGDELEEIRCFSVATQRSDQQRLEVLELVPAREMVLAGKHLSTFCARLKERCDDLELPRSQREALLDEVREGLLAPGRESLLALNYPGLECLFDYLGKVRWLLLDPPAIASAADEFAEAVRTGEDRLRGLNEPYVPAADFYLTPEDLERQLASSQRIELADVQVYQLDQDHPVYRVQVQGNAELRPDHSAHDGSYAYLFDRLQQWIHDDWRILLVCHQQGQVERLLDLFETRQVA
ncbi:MAG: transcription-repair coupling factor, partial [Desulfuromonadales bacterium]|nr:transcription-repair coupling factor [Desulfuromonadales bacterium]